MAALDVSRGKHLKSVSLLALETAMRRGEILALRWEHADLKRRVLHLPETKNGSSRDVPLSTKAVAVLESLPRNITGRVFDTSETAITEGFQRAAKRAGLPDFRFHDLRHEATSRLAEKLQMHELGKVTGHKSPRMLMRYYHPRAEDLAKKLG
ncbi:MAG: site-specific integrase [Sulfuricella sp.]